MAPGIEDENNAAATNGTSRTGSLTTNGTTNSHKISDPNGVTLSRLPENHDPLQTYKIDKFDDGLRYDTLQIHGGHRPDKETHARAVPIYNSVPTVAVFEKRAAALEGGTAAVATSSGQAAIFNTIICLAGAGDNIVASINLYGGTYSLFKTLLPRLGITVKWAKRETREEFEQYIDDKTKMVFVEAIGNPRCSIPDLQDLGDLAHENNVPFVVDNTFGACGTWCRPIDFGANIIVHSATKWMGGHGTTLGGVIIDCGTFDWGKAIDRFPRLSNKEGPMSFSYWKSFGNICFAMAMRIDILMEVGSILAPASAQQLLIGLEGNIYHDNAKRYLKNGFGGVLSFAPKGGELASKMLMNYVKVVSHQTNVGDAKTLATHPWNSTHVIMSEKDRREAGITPAFIRFSVGIEDIQDIIDDLDQALAKLPEDLLNAFDEKLVQKLETNAKDEVLIGDLVDYNDTDVLVSKTNHPPGRQQAVGNWQ
ncbi:o-acetylhomoserine (thiol)-lyase [Stemphylium lycopersici]|uniref:O-acetylhomoserine (Thiol)-lyase n=1 Tax=Stemphylium lycopersici TaxID=183478 RepID=A0A364MSJ7_STELY|nr:o-acetylhomoserine (thiol)-lyase [Stemphylium lycopersici]